MVLTVTINPLLEKNLFFNDVSANNRAYKEEYTAGGKGINISRQLNVLGIQNHAITFLGGSKGKIIRSVLEKEQISFSPVSTKSETREATLIYDEKTKNLKTYFGVNSQITSEEISQFISKMEKAITNSSIVVFSGSLPTKESSIIIEKGIEFCNKNDTVSILDSYGETLPDLIQLGPTAIHNNLNEIENSLKVKLESPDDFQDMLNKFYNYGINLAFITAGKKSTYASKADFHYRVDNPKIEEINSTGSGDAFLSGIIYGLEKALIFNDFVKLGTALGALNASRLEVCKVKLNEALDFASHVSISEIGKKIKLIDDSPTI
ncbi:MAG: 1-phosphofructokinase [Ignavibacteriae bacterium]|nr:1-phosphofructokinase [Ignavibacteriota bacterium]